MPRFVRVLGCFTATAVRSDPMTSAVAHCVFQVLASVCERSAERLQLRSYRSPEGGPSRRLGDR
jgi:hypothetical protein